MENKNSVSEFGKRVVALRKAKGLTQTELGKRVGLSKRMVAYYESQTHHFPAQFVIPFAKAFKISLEEFLGVKKLPLNENNHAALWRRLKKAETLSKSDQHALLKVLDGFLAKSTKL